MSQEYYTRTNGRRDAKFPGLWQRAVITSESKECWGTCSNCYAVGGVKSILWEATPDLNCPRLYLAAVSLCRPCRRKSKQSTVAIVKRLEAATREVSP